MPMPKQIVVTGASSGIGAALVQALAADGHRVYAGARRLQQLRKVTREDTRAASHPCDVSQEEQVTAFVTWISKQTSHVDALVHCAGGFGAIGPVRETDSQAWLQTVHTNLFGTYSMIKHLLPLLEKSASPRIVTFSGGGAFSPFANYSAYAVSKAAVVRLTETLALELAPQGMAINAVAPGFVATEIHDATLRSGPGLAGHAFFKQTQRSLQEGSVPIEVPVACVKFLLSEAARGLTGKTISASFDPWGTPAFSELIPQLNTSDVYTMRRINPSNLSDAKLRQALEQADHEKIPLHAA